MADPKRRSVAKADVAASRIDVRKTYKLYIGGAFPRSESGRSYVVRAPTERRSRTPVGHRARTSATRSAPRARRSTAGPTRPR